MTSSADHPAQITGLWANLADLISEPPAAAELSIPLPPRVLLTVDEAAEQLNIDRTTAWALVRRGELESVRIGPLRRVPVDAIASYAARLIEAEGLLEPRARRQDAPTPTC